MKQSQRKPVREPVSKGDLLSWVGRFGWAFIGILVSFAWHSLESANEARNDIVVERIAALRDKLSVLEDRGTSQKEVLVSLIRGEKDKIKLLSLLTKDQKLVSAIALFSKGEYQSAMQVWPTSEAGAFPSVAKKLAISELRAKLDSSDLASGERAEIFAALKIVGSSPVEDSTLEQVHTDYAHGDPPN